jgi:outer membrane protein TolC
MPWLVPNLPAARAASRCEAGLLWVCALALLTLSGCTRAMYREQADAEVYAAVREKSNDPRWHLQNYTINVDPRSRMYDGYDPDNEPLPPDDPTANKLMHYVDGMEGYPCWNLNGTIDIVENPEWLAHLARNDRGEILLDLNQSVRLGLLHSREYQRELEDLYLSALDVTFERFRFDVQYFAGNDTFFTADGPRRNGTGQSSSLLTNDTNLQANKLFASGGQLMVNVANSLVWQFSGTDTSAATTLLDFSFVQPLLRGGVKSRVLERLTLSERTLLGNIRAMERYRRGFYVNVTTGRDAGTGPQRRGGVLGTGLSGFTGLAGGFGRVATQTNAANTGGTAGGAGAGQAGGFIGLLQTQLQLRNQEANVAALADSLAQITAAYDAGRIDRFQVDFSRQALFNARSQLLTAKATFQTTQDNFKITLGLPPHLEFRLQDPLLSPFQLIDPAIPPLQNRLTDTQEVLGQRIVSIQELVRPGNQAITPQAVQEQLAALRQILANTADVQKRALKQFVAAEADLRDLQSAIPQRKQILKSLEKRDVEYQSKSSGETKEFQRAAGVDDPADRPIEGQFKEDEFRKTERVLEELPVKLRGELRSLAEVFLRYPAQFQEVDAVLAEIQARPDILTTEFGRAKFSQILARFPDLLVNLSTSILELSLIQARARAESVTLLTLEMDPANALAIASRNRRDWMNARANLVDTWRLIEFNANDLESDLNFLFGGDISTVGDNPVDFRSATGRLRVGVQFDAPLTRVAERNNYRQSLIEYQQARRDYYAFVDRISQSLRSGLRQIELDQANFELRRAAVRVAIDQVEVTRLRLSEPPKPGVVAAFSPTTARDLVSALGDLLNVQNDFMSVWVNYEVERMNLDFNLDTMQLDEEGLWIDPGSAVGLNGLQAMADEACLDDQPAPLPWDRAMHEGRERIEALQKAAKKAEAENPDNEKQKSADEKAKKFEFHPPREPETLPMPRQTQRAPDTQVRQAAHAAEVTPQRAALQATVAPRTATQKNSPSAVAPRAGSISR